MSRIRKFFFGGSRFIFAFALVKCFFVLNAFSNNNQFHHYPYLTDILDEYYCYYLQAPNSISNIVSFANYLYKKDPRQIRYYHVLQKITFPKLQKMEKEISFIETDCGFNVYVSGIEVYSNIDSPCCDSISLYKEEERAAIIKNKLRKIYYRKNGDFFFQKDNMSDILSIKKGIDSKYTFDGTKLYVFVIEDKISFFCKQDSLELENSYFRDLETELKEFMKNSNIESILFYSYYPLTSLSLSEKNECELHKTAE